MNLETMLLLGLTLSKLCGWGKSVDLSDPRLFCLKWAVMLLPATQVSKDSRRQTM